MKKNISINISGIIFHIEEDGYDTLRKYLDSVSKYFASFEDSNEIMADIESRIAEIFLSKLNEGKQVITAEDVSSLMTTMGSVNDFKAAEETSKEPGDSQHERDHQQAYRAPKQLLRDQKRKTLGGVCTGLGSYLNVDPVWIKILFVLLAFGYGTSVIIYIIMWIVVPGSYDLEEPEVNKKLFREPQKKVLGGVAGGLAAYFGIDIIVVRILFIISLFFFATGLIAYIILWIVIPEAKSLTDKMQMQGEPVTLSNIESTLKKNQNVEGNDDETTITKILLSPFRLIAMLLLSLSKIIGPVAEVLRVAVGILIIIIGFSLAIGTLVSGGILFGLLSGISFPHWLGADLNEIGFPIEIFKNTFPSLTIFAAFVVALIPSVFIILLGISSIAKRIVFGAAAGWTLFVLFFASVAILAISIPRIIYSFKEDGEYKLEKIFTPTTSKIILKLNQTGLDDYNVTSLTLKGYDGKDLKLEQTFGAQGSTGANAVENAHMVDYRVDFVDSILTFDSNIQFLKNAKFRGQRLEMTLFIPYNMPFAMDEDVCRFITQVIHHENLKGNTWTMTEKGLTCLTCLHPNREEEEDNVHASNFTDFDIIRINGAINATLTQGDHYAVELEGPESEKEKYKVYQNGNTLIIDFNNSDGTFWQKKNFNFSDLKINITVPDLEQLELKGAGKLNFSNFDLDDLDISIMGAMEVQGELHINDLSILISGASHLKLSGHGENMEAKVIGASGLDANDFEVKDASVEATGASHAKINATGTLEIEESVASDVDYIGSPEVVKKN